MKKIKSLVFDLDGTAVISRPDGMPSQTVIDAVRKAKQVCHVSIATGRTLEMSREIWQALEIEDLCILNGGAQLYSPQTREFIWKQEVETVVLQQLFSKLKEFRQYKVAYEKKPVPINLDKFIISEEAGLTLIFETQESDAQKIATIVKQFNGLTCQVVHSWKAGTFDVHISHELATKKHALHSLLAHQNISPDNCMVVGDGNNDLPLFDISGWKVAMGNAVDELKAKADWIAPSVDEDGLAVAIEKFILK